MNLTLDACDELIQQALQADSREAFLLAATPLVASCDIISFGLVRHDTYWRARIIDQNRYDDLTEMIHPPPLLVKKPGRLNDVHEPYFYMSSTIETAVAEVQPAPGQLVQVGGFRVASSQMLYLAFLGEYYNVYKRGFTNYWGDDPKGNIGRLIDSQPRARVRTNLLIDRFLAHVISDKDARRNDYIHSRALRELLLKKSNAHGIAFPSTMDLGGMNFGVQARPSDDLLQNVCCAVVRAGKERSFGDRDISYISVAAGLADGKRFVWSPTQDPIKAVLYNMTQEDRNMRIRPNA